jgi:hypothetical protein
MIGEKKWITIGATTTQMHYRESFHGLKETQMSKTMFLVIKQHLKYKKIHGN